MKTKLYYNESSESKFLADILKHKLEREGIIVGDETPEIGIAIGGDGSFLHMVAANDFNTDILYIGVNNGTLGFLTEIKPTELNYFTDVIKNSDYKLEHISYEEVKVVAENGEYNFKTLNEVVVRDEYLSTTYLKVTVDDKLLENFVGDGLLVSTPTGSTAYNLSGNGAIVYSDLHTMQITPLAPINNKVYRCITNPIVLPEYKVIKLYPIERTKDLIILADGKKYTIKDAKHVEIKICKDKLKCIRLNDYDYTTIINDKYLS